MAIECLDGIIGVTRASCDCEVGTLTQTELDFFQASKSGWYIDNACERFPSWSVFKSAFHCTNLYQLCTTAILDAKMFVHAEVAQEFAKKLKTSLNPVLESVGEVQYTTRYPNNSKVRGLKIYNGAASGVMSIHSIRLNLDVATTLDVKLLRRFDNGIFEEVKKWTATTVAGSFSTIMQTEEKLPLCKNGVPVEYYIVYDAPASEVQNSLTCNCPTKGQWKKYVAMQGIYADTIDDINTEVIYQSGYAHGFSIDFGFRCESGEIVCSNYDNDNDSAKSIALAVANRAGKILIDRLISSPRVNASTMISREELELLSELYETNARRYLSYGLNAMNFDANDCFFCNSQTIQMGTIWI
jgi:hypothetical protein